MAMKQGNPTDLVEIVRDRPITTSLKVAEVFEKDHCKVIRDIRTLIDDLGGIGESFQTPYFRKSTYKVEGQLREYPFYYMNRDAFTLLAMEFTGKKALQFKLAYIQIFEEEQAMHKKVIDDEEFYVADTIEEALIAWFGEETGKKMFEILSEPDSPKQGYVYVLKMNNGTVKIGVATDVLKRSNTIENSSGLEVDETFSTGQIDRRVAYKVEHACHKTFAAYRAKGEFFTVSFAEACAELKKQLERFGAKLLENEN